MMLASTTRWRLKMELTLPCPQPLFHTKFKENFQIYYEEGPLPPNTTLALAEVSSVLNQLIKHSRSDCSSLAIIDSYFLNVLPKDARTVAEALHKILDGTPIQEIHIYYDRRQVPKKTNNFFLKRWKGEKTSFQDILKSEFCDGNITYTKMKRKKIVHDRFWILSNSYGMIVGTSFNGIGKHLSFACPIPNEDIPKLIEELAKCGIIL